MEAVQREAFCPQGLKTEPYFTYVPTKWRRGDGTNSLKHLVSQNTKTPMRDSLEKYPRKQLARSWKQYQASQTPLKMLLMHMTTAQSQTCKQGSQATQTRMPPKELLILSWTKHQGKKPT